MKETILKIKRDEKGRFAKGSTGYRLMKGKKHTKETLRKMSEAHKGHPVSEMTKQLIREKKLELFRSGKHKPTKHNKQFKKGFTPWNKGMKGLVPWNKGKKMPEEQKPLLKKIHAENWKNGKYEGLRQKLREARMKQKFPIKNTKPEKILFDELSRKGILYEKHKTIVYDKENKKFTQPDAVIQPNICVFVNGDYWHGNPKKYSHYNVLPNLPGGIPMGEKWKKDTLVRNELKKQGYKVLILWESDIEKGVAKCVDTIEFLLSEK